MNICTCYKYKKTIELFKLIDLDSNNFKYIFKVIHTFFDSKIKIKDLCDTEIYESLSIFYLIKKVILNINNKINDIFFEKIEQEKSAFDEYDKENDYEELEEESENIYDTYLNVINKLFKVSRQIFGNSLKESLDMDINELLDYFSYYIETLEEEKDEED